MENKNGVKILVFGSVLQLFFGIIYVWSVFVLPVSAHLNWAVADAKLTSSFMLSFFVLGMLIGGRLETKVGTSRLVLCGGVIMAGGMLASSFVSSAAPWMIYINYGIIGGLGCGAAYNSIISCAQKSFPKKRGMATGISVCAFGFSTVVFAPLVEVFIGAFGLMETFRILAALFAAVTIALFSFIKLPEGYYSRAAEAGAGTPDAKKQYGTLEMLKSPRFYFITVSLMLGTVAYFVLNPSFKTLALERGLEPAVATGLVMITGVSNAIGRLTIPVISDKLTREITDLIVLGLTVICCLVLVFAEGFLFIASVAVIACCYGGLSGLYPLFTSDNFGIKNVGSNYAAVMCGFALSSLFSPMLIGLIGDVSVKFITVGLTVAIGFLFVIALMISKRRGAAGPKLAPKLTEN